MLLISVILAAEIRKENQKSRERCPLFRKEQEKDPTFSQ